MSRATPNRLLHIQGLRGLAVGLVVLYHAGFLFHGGFIGVDIFFVISGFVIGNSLNRELLDNGKISWRRFFFRRVRRLVPALSITLLGTVIMYWIFFGAATVDSLTQPLVRGSFFLSNWYFFLDRGYVALDGNPLRNLWSLSVEEQFYFALPLVFIFTKFLSTTRELHRRRLLILVVVFLTISFLGNVILVNHSLRFGIPQFLLPRRFGFFSPFTRAWEFLAGLAIAFTGFQRITKKVLAFGGIFSISTLLFSAFWLDGWQPFPGWYALPIVVCSAILLGIPSDQVLLNRFFSNKPLVYLGDISYSLYLVHWPILVILKQKYGSAGRVTIIALLCSLVVSVVIYQLAENPIRKMPWLNRKRFVIAFSVLVFAPIGAVKLVSNIAQGNVKIDTKQSTPLSEIEIRRSQVSLGSKVCLDVYKVGLPKDLAECTEGVSETLPLVFLLGDSHVYSASEGVIAAAKRNGFRVMSWSRSGCPFLVTSSVNRLCNGNRNYLLEAIASEKPEVIVIANGFNHYLEGLRDEGFVPRGLRSRISDAANSYGETVRYLLGFRIPTVLMYEIPNMGESERDLSEFKLRSAIISAINKSVLNVEQETRQKVLRVEPADALCLSGVCRAYDSSGRPIYADGQHLNADGSLMLATLFDKVFQSLNSN